MVDVKEIRLSYKNFLNDIDFEKLELKFKQPNIFKILNISKAEIRHSSFLAWLLNPNENHGLNNLFLKKFLREVFIDDTLNKLDELDLYNINYNNSEVRREWNDIDILIIVDNYVICIENKFESKEHSNQLERYFKIINKNFKEYKKAFVYLTPFGDKPTSEFGQNTYIIYSYEKIIQHIEQIKYVYSESLNEKVKIYLKDYISILKRELMQNDDLNILASKIYKNHKELIEFIYKNKPDLASDLYFVFEKYIKNKGLIIGSKNKGYIRFTTPKIKKITPNIANGWIQKENFLFEIDFYWNNSQKAIFKSVVAPSISDIQDVYCEALSDIPDAKKPSGKKWLVHFQHNWSFDKSIYHENVDEEEVFDNLDKQWSKISNIIEKVESALLRQENKLIKYLN